MGLLTKPGTSIGEKNQLVVLLERFGLKFAILMYFVGVAWLLALAHTDYNLGTYFSENALLPGLVVENYAENQMPTVLKTLTDKEKADTLSPADFGELLKQVGIHEVQYQNFTIIHPINGQDTAGATIHGTNTYGILRAKRAAGTEALVFSTPYFSRNAAGRKNLVGISMMLALAEYFQRQVYWAKDIIFLIPDGHIGTLAWVKGHQEIHDNNPYFLSERVRTKSGNIQAAINVVMESNTICSLETKFHGLNGKLPNLDLVNLMNKFVVTAKDKYTNWEADIWKLISYIQVQATGTPTGSHGFFLKYGIESITLAGRGSPKNCKRPQAFGDIARVLEATFRSLNNLLERFHQSYFFYLKTLPNRFISIGLYYPPIALILLVIPLKGAILWLTRKDMETTRGLAAVAGFHALALGARWLLANSKKCFLFPAELQFTPEIFTLLVVSLASLQVFLITSYIQHQRSQSPSTGANLVDSIYCFVLLELATCLYSLALFNPSVVIVIGLVVVPLIILVQPGKFPAFTSWLLVLALLTVGISFYYPSLHHVINKYYYESEIYGNFLFDLCFLMFVPIVSTFIAII